jgi:hypothetical protein
MDSTKIEEGKWYSEETLKEEGFQFSTTHSGRKIYKKQVNNQTIWVFWNPKTSLVERILPYGCMPSTCG